MGVSLGVVVEVAACVPVCLEGGGGEGLSISVDAVEGSECDCDCDCSLVSELAVGSALLICSTIHHTPQPARASFPMKSDRKDQKR